MALRDLVIRSQLIPPRQRRGFLRRPRLDARLAAVLDYPLTIVQAGTGYGKSTALATLGDTVDRLSWYTITEPDRDPLLFLAHLVCAFEHREPTWCEPALAVLEESGGRVTPSALTPLLNTLTLEMEDEAILVLDDYHLVDDVPEVAALAERLVDYIPPRLHVVISTRQMPPFDALPRWRVKDQVLTITRRDLAFTADEIEALFCEQYDYPLSTDQAQALAAETEGWAIALQMVWQSLQRDGVSSMDAILGQLPTTLDTLFDYLAQDVLSQQPAAIQRFLLTSSVLREMDGPSCDHLMDREGSANILQGLHESGLFVVSVGEEVYRYHRLFHDFLQAHLKQDVVRAHALHRRAAEYYWQVGHSEETVYHLLEAQEYDRAARMLEELGPGLVALGRLDSLSAWLDRLPQAVQEAHPGLQLLAGDVHRLRAHFDEALDHYVAAERLYGQQRNQLGRSQALGGQAQVYLDTVRPLKADSLLEEALRLLEPEEHRQETAELLDRLAENKLNLGYPDESQALHHEARLLRTTTDPGDVYLEARAMVRTGRMVDARELLEKRAEEERQVSASRPQRFHRETLLLLSLVHALLGGVEAADRCAREGIAIGQRLQSPFVEAVGYMRLGHAVQLRGCNPWIEPSSSAGQKASDLYQRAIELVRTFRVMRTQAEPLWGLCRVSGYGGDLPAAERYAEEAMETVRRAGDEWMQNLVRSTLGAGYILAGHKDRGRDSLTEAAKGFARVGDVFGRCAAWLWLALDAWWQGDAERAMFHLSSLLPLARQQGYDSLLTRRTFLGLKHDEAAVPLLVEAQRRDIEADYAGRLLDGMGLEGIDYHPGYALSVRTLGAFAVWRGDELVTPRDWKREKARQVFQLLLTYPQQWFYREQIIDHLWPHLPPEAAERDFKVALNALHGALEPSRPRGIQAFFVIRKGSVYGLNPVARIAVDVGDLKRLAAEDDIDLLRQALALYEDDYLPDSVYEDWPAAERQRLRHLYMTAAERLARHLLQARAWDDAIQVCQAILARDNCWEAAYRLLMRAYAAQGNRPQVHSTYQRCVTALDRELGVEPSPTTRSLFEKLV